MIIARQCLRVRTVGFLLAILLALVDRAAAQINAAFGEEALEQYGQL
jgi:hypothetical protein